MLHCLSIRGSINGLQIFLRCDAHERIPVLRANHRFIERLFESLLEWAVCFNPMFIARALCESVNDHQSEFVFFVTEYLSNVVSDSAVGFPFLFGDDIQTQIQLTHRKESSLVVKCHGFPERDPDGALYRVISPVHIRWVKMPQSSDLPLNVTVLGLEDSI